MGVQDLPRDAFGLPEVSQRQTIFDSKHLFDALPLLYDDQQVSGGGTSSAFTSPYVDLEVSATTAGRRVRQTFDRFNYQPGKGLLIELTGVLGNPAPGVTRRLGYFDDDNGLFFESAPDGVYIVLRKAGSDTRVSQDRWNSAGDPILKRIDFSKSQIFAIEIEWLGVGDVVMSFVIRQQKISAHIFGHYNQLTAPYMDTPNLPVRYEIIADGTNPAADSLRHICSTVMVQGGINPVGFVHTAARDAVFTMASNTNWQPFLSMRLKSGREAATVEIINTSVVIPVSAQDALVEFGLFLNPTIAGVDAASWVGIANSSIEYDQSRTNVNTLTGGARIAGSYISQAKNEASNSDLRVPNVRKFGASIAGVSDEFILAGRFLGGTAPTVYALANLLELQ